MIDLASISGFEWDDGNASKSWDKHRVAQVEAEQVFIHNPLVSPDLGHSHDENRYQALGETNAGRRLHVTFTLRQSGKRIRVISARDMNRKERFLYDQST